MQLFKTFPVARIAKNRCVSGLGPKVQILCGLYPFHPIFVRTSVTAVGVPPG
jgi:hypothetical protein